MPDPISFPLKINVAGEEHNDFLPDQLWSSAVEYGHMNGNYQITGESIGNTFEEPIYQTSLNRGSFIQGSSAERHIFSSTKTFRKSLQ